MNDPSIKNEQVLGGRDLAMWVGDGILHFPTYTYTDLNG